MQRVLLVIEQGTASRYWQGSVPLLKSCGIEVLLATVRERGPLHANLEKLGCPVFALGCSSSRDYPAASLRLARLIRRQRIDVVHACEAIPATLGGIAGIVARRGVRIFHRQHCVVEGKQVPFSRLGSRFAHLTMAISASAAQYAQDLDGVSPSRVRVAYSGVDEPRLVSDWERIALRRQLGVPETAPVISIVARLRREKGHLTLLQAAVPLAASLDQRPHIVIVGGGPEEGRIRERAPGAAPACVHFVGHQEDVAPWFALADVVAMPSHREAFGLSAAEAMASSRPLVASRVGGLPEVVQDGVTGLLVPPETPEALAEALLRILRCPGLAQRMGAAAYRRFQTHFTMRAMVAAWRRCYADALTLKATQGRSNA